MQIYCQLILACIFLCSVTFARADIFHGVNFSCTAVPQANINGVTTASEVRTAAKNVSAEKLVIRYHVVVTSSQGRVEDYDYTRGGQKGTFIPQAIESHSSTPFEKASVQDEFPQTCQFTKIQVCPADPPADFPKGHYYRPFIDGDKECKAVGKISLALPAASPSCSAVVVQEAYNTIQGTHLFLWLGFGIAYS